MVGGSFQDRERAEDLTAVDKGEGEEGEEEEPCEVDSSVDPDVKSEFSKSMVRAPAPQVSFGSLSQVPDTRKKAAPKRKRENEPAAQEEDLLMIDLEAAESNPALAHPEILQVPRFKMLVEMLDACPPCFLGLLPDRVLRGREKPGRQLRGVGG